MTLAVNRPALTSPIIARIKELLLCGTLLMLVAGCGGQTHWDEYAYASGVRTVPVKQFVAYHAGMTRPEFEELCGNSGQYEFSLSRSGYEFLCVRYLPVMDDGTETQYFYALYRNNVLNRILLPSGLGVDRPEVGPTVTDGLDQATKLVDDGVGLSPEEVQHRITQTATAARKERSEPSNLGPLVFLPWVNQGPSVETIRLTADVHAKFDGRLSSLGMNERKIQSFYGKSLQSSRLASGACMRLWYSDFKVIPPVTPEAQAGLAVLINNGQAIAIFGENFFPWRWVWAHSESNCP